MWFPDMPRRRGMVTVQRKRPSRAVALMGWIKGSCSILSCTARVRSRSLVSAPESIKTETVLVCPLQKSWAWRRGREGITELVMWLTSALGIPGEPGLLPDKMTHSGLPAHSTCSSSPYGGAVVPLMTAVSCRVASAPLVR